MPIRITMGEFRAAPFRIVFDMSPIWDRMAREFSDVATSVLRDEMEDIGREMGKEMLRQIRKYALPHSFTGRLADARVPAHGGTWRYWITPRGPGGRGTGTYGPEWYVTVGMHRPATVSPARGRPVEFYASAIEFGAKPQYPLGRIARQRIRSWATERSLTSVQAHRIAWSIYRKGTRAHPYFTPAARATAKTATGWLKEGGKNWRDRVEAHFAG